MGKCWVGSGNYRFSGNTVPNPLNGSIGVEPKNRWEIYHQTNY